MILQNNIHKNDCNIHICTNICLLAQAAGMVVHPAPGNPTGTLVNAFLHHCHLAPVSLEPQQVADDSSGTYSGAQPVLKARHLLVYPLFLFLLLVP